MSESPRPAAAEPFHLTGNFAPIREEFSEFDLDVTGSIPPELCGRYFRNGANPQTGWSAHWFLGNGMIHGVEIRDGRANWYRNRYVRTPLFADAEADPMAAIADLRMSAANTHVIRHAGRILALEEAHLPFEVTSELETKGAHDFGGRLAGPFTAHPKICPVTGEMFAFGYSLEAPYVTTHRISAAGELVQSEAIEVPGPTMVHDFNVTRNHVVLMDLPLVWDLAALSDGGLPVRWSDDYGARLGVMPRDGTNADLRWFEIEPCYVFHPMNAWEDGDSLVLDVCRSARLMKAGEADAPPLLHRWTVDLASGSVTEATLDDRPMEFPRIHDGRVGLRNRYGYTAGLAGDAPGIADCFHKIDHATGAVTTHALPGGRRGGEPVFVPASGGSAEDDGWVLSFVYDPATDRSDLVILDGTRFDGAPVARIHLPTRVPYGFHGSWLPDARG